MTLALAIFVKTPDLSPVKTRLAAGIGAPAALRFHQLAAAATAEVARACEPWLTPYWAIAEAGPTAIAAWPGFASLHQGEGDLGERLHTVYADLQARHGRVLLIGADAPQLTIALLQQALTVLDDPRTPFVIGDASDGGFWLFGGRIAIPRAVWTRVRYSQTQTAAELQQHLAPHGAVGKVGRLTDVDNAEDLPALRDALDRLSHPLPVQQALRQWLDTVAAPAMSVEREA
ncbi:MAG: TIGR04282 family arsenosugar biosynthesis glycosyltransferase [Rhodanobacter sp.]